MREFRLADESMLPDLMEMTKTSFNEGDRSVSFFFKNKVKLDECTVCIQDKKVVSQLHMPHLKILCAGDEVPSSYVYAASTLPEYRKQGCMTQLLEYSFKILRERGQKYSVLVPANENLFKFYRKLGYYKYYKHKEVLLSSDEMQDFRLSKQAVPLEYERIRQIRQKFYNQDGEIVWDSDSIKFAFDMNVNLSGKNVFDGQGYALSYLSNKNVVEVTDIAYENGNIENLLANLYQQYGNRDGYKIRLPLRDKFFAGRGKTATKGMICPIDSRDKKSLMKFIMESSQKGPCMGFGFE